MTRDELLDAIGGVDEEFLVQSEETCLGRQAPVLRRGLLVAAIVAVCAMLLGAMHLMGVPITEIRLTGGTDSVEMNGKLVISGPQESVRIEMDFPVADDVTRNMRCIYLPNLSDDWGVASGSCGSTGIGVNEVNSLGLTWMLPGMAEGEYFWFYQESAYYHKETYDEIFGDMVSSISALPETVTMTAENELLGPYHVLRVTVDPVRHLTGEQQTVSNTRGGLMPDGEAMVIWSDGYHVFHLRYPTWVPDETILAFMESLQPVEMDIKRVVAEYTGSVYKEKGE